jgi:GNAT superfamily N-acetyltransferase
MIREMRPQDRDALEAFLISRIDEAMFPIVNLRAHGLGNGGFASNHDHASRFWRLGDDSLVALTQGGMIMALLGVASNLGPLRQVLAGHRVTGAVGPAASVRPVLDALGLTGLPARKDADEPGFGLDLSDLRIPELPGSALVPASGAFRPVATDWRAAYHVEILGITMAEARLHAEKEMDAYIARDSLRILVVGGAPVAMTGFNATLPEIVQIGGVYTPPALRNRGYARQAVALHLAEARAAGVARAVLFAASDAAVRAYLALGFKPTRAFALVLLSYPTTIVP